MTEPKPVDQKARGTLSPPRPSPPTCRVHQARRWLGGTMMSLAVWALVGFAVVATATEIGRDAPITSQADSHDGEDDHAGGGHVDPFSLGLIILAVIVGIVATGEVIPSEIVRISLMSAIFLGAIMLLGERFARGAARVMGVLDRSHNKLLFPLALAFALSWVANMIELATIVGAFAAGLILNDDQFDQLEKQSTIEELVAPLERIFAPVFFVLMGMQVNVASFLDTNTITLAIVFTVVAIVGKLVAGLPAGPGIRRIAVGIGMVPRGEVGLIFASIGRGLNVVGDAVFSALVVMIMATTLVTPPALKWALPRQVDRE